MKSYTQRIKLYFKKKKESLNTPEIKSALVQISHKIPSNNSRGVIIHIKGQYYRIKELG